jgi:hypothetical protein
VLFRFMELSFFYERNGKLVNEEELDDVDVDGR